MSSEELYETELYWSEPAHQVTVTGAFDDWARSVPMEKTSTVWAAKVKVPYGSKKVEFKFIVDGQWEVNHHFPTTFDAKGNLNNYIITRQAPEPTPAPVPAPAPEVAPEPVVEQHSVPEPVPEKAPEPVVIPVPEIKTDEKPAVSEPQAEPEPVTPVNPPHSVEPAVTPMVVPPSAITAQEGLSDVDPAISRQIIEAVLDAEKEGGKEVEIKGKDVDTLVVKVDEPVKQPEEVAPTAVVAAGEPIAVPAVEAIAADLSTPREELKALSDATPAVDTSVPATGAVELNTPVARPSTPPPTTAPAPQTPVPVDTKSTPKADETQPPPSAFSTSSTTSSPSKPERPGTLGGSVKKSSSRGSRIFSFPGRRTSQDSTAVDSAPSTPGSVRKDPETARKKKNSFMAKVHDIFHPHPKLPATP